MTEQSCYCFGLPLLRQLSILANLLILSSAYPQSPAKIILLFDDQNSPKHVNIWGWGSGGKGQITNEVAKFGEESIEVISPTPLSGAVIAADFGLNIYAMPWSRAFLQFWLRPEGGERGKQFNVHISTEIGDADCYFEIKPEEAKDGWFLVRLPLVRFRNLAQVGGKVRAIGFKSAGRLTEASKRFFVDRIAFEIAEKPAVPLELAPKAKIEVSKEKLIAGDSLQISVNPFEQCNALLRAVSEDGSVGRMLLKRDEIEKKITIEWNGLGDEIREPWGVLRWGRIDRAFLPDGKYNIIVTLFKPAKEGLIAVDFEFPTSLKGFGSRREIHIYHKPPGAWMHVQRLRLLGREKEVTLRQELTPSAFGSLFPESFLLRVEGVDITENGITLGKSSPENLALNSKVKVCAEENPGAAWGGWHGLIDGSDAWWTTPQDYPINKPVWFELTLPKEVAVAKVMIKQAHGVEERNRIKRLILSFDDGSKVELELPKDTACHWFYIEPPRKTTRIYAEAAEFWGERRGRCGLSEFQVFEAASYRRGYFVTNDIMPIGATKWVKFVGLHRGKVRWEYSLDHGESWHIIPEGGGLSKVPLKWGVIRFRCTIEGNAIVHGFELTWCYDPEKPLAKPLNPKTCALKVKDGMFFDRVGRRVRLFGWSYSPPFAPKGYIHIDLEQWLSEREREVASFANYGINCVRLWLPGTLYLPDGEEAFPDSQKYAKVMKENGYCPLFPHMVDKLIKLLASYGIYTIFEFHDNPPWGYWSPIQASGAKTHPQDYPKAFEFARPRIAKLWRWVARHFKENPFIVGFEVPWNEPVIGHRPWDIKTKEDSVRYDRTYRQLVEDCVKAIKSEDPERICILGPNGWNSIRCDEPWIPPSSFWLLPEGVEAFHFHDYPQHTATRTGTMCERFAYPRASGVPIVRTEGHCRYFFWNKHDVEPGWGERGVDSMLAQEFAMGLEGTTGWGHGGGEREIFGTDFARYHVWVRFWREVNPREKANIAIVMASEKRHKSDELLPHPVVEALLRLHVLPFDFLFDNCVLIKTDWLKRYKALILFTEDLPEEVAKAVKESEVPHYEFDPKSEGAVEKLGQFLEKNGILVDQKSPPNILTAYGDSGIVLYERLGKGGEYRVFLRLQYRGKIMLWDECTDEVLYKGDAQKLWESGLKIRIEPFRAKLIRFKIL